MRGHEGLPLHLPRNHTQQILQTTVQGLLDAHELLPKINSRQVRQVSLLAPHHRLEKGWEALL